MYERQVLEDLLKDAEAMVAKLKAWLAEEAPTRGSTDNDPAQTVDASAGSAIDLVQSQKTSDNTGNY